MMKLVTWLSFFMPLLAVTVAGEQREEAASTGGLRRMMAENENVESPSMHEFEIDKRRSLEVGAGGSSFLVDMIAGALEYDAAHPQSLAGKAKSFLANLARADSDCDVWVLESTYTFGLNSSLVSVSSLTSDVCQTAVDAIETALLGLGSLTVTGTQCVFTTKSFDFVKLSSTDANANSAVVDIDWSLIQNNCGTETSTHSVLKTLDYSQFISFFNTYGDATGQTFLSAITDLSYNCPRDCYC